MTTRFRTERCTAHGIAIGLCESALCKAPASTPVAGLLVRKLKKLKCNTCKRSGADVQRLGEFHRGTSAHPGYQTAWCPGCWENHLARKKAAELRAAQGHVPRPRSADRMARILRQQQESETND